MGTVSDRMPRLVWRMLQWRCNRYCSAVRPSVRLVPKKFGRGAAGDLVQYSPCVQPQRKLVARRAHRLKCARRWTVYMSLQLCQKPTKQRNFTAVRVEPTRVAADCRPHGYVLWACLAVLVPIADLRKFGLQAS